MGRHSKGPIRLNNGLTWYARLTIRPADRQQAGKTRLIRSLGTTDYSIALRRYGSMMDALEHELRQLLAGNSLRQQVEDARYAQWITPTGYEPMEPGDKALIYGLDDNEAVMEALTSGKPLPPTWDELIGIYIRVKSRTRNRDIAPRTIKALELSVNRVRDIAQPHELNKQHVKALVHTMEQTLKPVTVKQQLSLLSSLVQVAIRNDVIDIINPFPLVDYQVGKNQQSRRAFTDSELRSLDGPLLWLVLTGMRPSELATRTKSHIDNGMIMITSTDTWRPKTLSSERRIPMPTGLELATKAQNHNAITQQWRRDLRKLIADTTVTPHSGRHTFAELGRRAAVEPRVMEALMGHGSTVGSTSTKKYGEFPDSVLQSEIHKIWSLIADIQHLRPT
jgi:integrase